MVNSRAKGNRAEREVIKTLKKYFPGRFERRTMGLAGADIVAPGDFKWAIEVKHDKSVRLKHIWKPTLKLMDFWLQARTQAAIAKKTPLLIAKIEGIWLCWEEIPNSFDFAHWVHEFEDWCKDNEDRSP
jgi:Holliday junction resolvase